MTSLNDKPWWASKTIWVNIIAAVAAISTAFGLDLGLGPEQQTAIVGGIMAVANVILRLVTDSPIKRARKTSDVRAGALPGLLAVLLAAMVLAGCAGSAETRATNALAAACDSYATALGQLAERRAAGALSPDAVARVDRINETVDPLCLPGSSIDPAEAVGVVRSGLSILTSIKESL